MLINSLRLDEEGLAKLDELGKVTDVIRLGGFHGSDDPFYKERYGATSWAIEGQVYFNGVKIHENVRIQKVWGGPNSGLDGGNDSGNGITNRPGGLKLQAEGYDVRYRNIWIKELDLTEANTDF